MEKMSILMDKLGQQKVASGPGQKKSWCCLAGFVYMSTLLFDSSFFLFSLLMQECLEELLLMYAMHFSGYEI